MRMAMSVNSFGGFTMFALRAANIGGVSLSRAMIDLSRS